MAIPAAFPIALYINGIARTADISYADLYLDDHRTDVSTFEFTIYNPDGYTPARNDTVLVTDDDVTTVIFYGIITDIETVRRGVVTDYNLTASDLKVRLQKSVLAPKTYTGTDAEILSELLSDAFPDLSSVFDFDTNVTGVQENLEFEIGDTNVLDALNKLSEETGVSYQIEPGELTSEGIIFTFDTGGPDEYTVYDSGIMAWEVTAGKGEVEEESATSAVYGTSSSFIGGNDRMDIGVNTGDGGQFEYNDNITVEDIWLRVAVNMPELSGGSFRLYMEVWDWDAQGVGGSKVIDESEFYNQGDDYLWDFDTFEYVTIKLTDLTANELPLPVERFWYARIEVDFFASESGTYEVGIDNVRLVGASESGEPSNDPTVPPTPNLQWGLTAPQSPFDFDIDNSDEYLDDLVISTGDYDFNAIVIAGGKSSVDVDWTYESDGDMDHINLEVPIRDYTISINDGTDGSPSWTAQTVGIWGTDTLTGNGGDKDALYDDVYHWLYFDSNPPALSKSIRLEATIDRPIRVAVNDAGAGEPVLATVIYDENVTSEDEALARAQAELDRRNQPTRMRFTTYEPGLRAGQELNIVDSGRGVNQTSVIQRVVTQWLGPSGHATFTVEAGPRESYSADQLIAANDARSRGSSTLGASGGSVTLAILTDNNGNPLFDNDGKYLYEVQ